MGKGPVWRRGVFLEIFTMGAKTLFGHFFPFYTMFINLISIFITSNLKFLWGIPHLLKFLWWGISSNFMIGVPPPPSPLCPSLFRSYFGNSIWGRHLPVRALPKAILLLWVIMIFILTKAYSGSLISSLTYPTAQRPIDTFEQLIKAKDRSVVFFIETYHHDFFKSSVNSELEKIYQKFKDGGGKMISFRHMKDQLLKHPEMVIPVSKSINQDTTVISWGLPMGQTFGYWSKETLYPTGGGLGFTKGSGMNACVNLWIIRTWDFGLHFKWREDGNREARLHHPVFRNKPEMENMKAVMISLPSKLDGNQRLSIAQLQSGFYVYFIIMALAMLSFLCEKLLMYFWETFFTCTLGNTVDSAYNIHGYKGQPVIVATKIMSHNPH